MLIIPRLSGHVNNIYKINNKKQICVIAVHAEYYIIYVLRVSIIKYIR